ncbi:MAG: glycosyltransferase WbuB [Paraglaciecola sp.]|uniref:glycosyltransferase WbuB n=1 Tax=Paraglaciecola sp. TaxID=1920173 RepID=UPI0032996232
MRILIITTNFTPELTGIGKYSGEMATWLANNGNNIRIVCSAPYYPEWKVNKKYSGWKYTTERANNTDILRCPIWVPTNVTTLKRILHLGSFALSSFPVIIKQALWKPDVVICVEPPIFNSMNAILVSKLCSAKSILHVQDFEVDAAFNLGMIKAMWLKKLICKLEICLLKQFTNVSTISKSMLKMLDEKMVPKHKQLLFPNWVDTSFISPLKTSSYRDSLNIPDEKIVAMYSGNMGEKQGLEIIITAARHLPEIQFVMCGSGAALNRLKNTANHLSNIIWLELQPYEKLNDFLNLADVHLLPQQADAADLVMPSKLTGMLSSGKPVVATADEDTEVYAVVKGCGLLVKPAEDIKFAEAIRTLANDTELRIKLGKNARKYAESHLNFQAIMMQFSKELSSLLKVPLEKAELE